MKTPARYLLLFVVTLMGCGSLRAQDWTSDLQSILGEYLACGPEMTDDGPCNLFLARALKRVYGIDDFVRPNDKKKPAMLANEIANYVATSTKWTLIGDALSAEALDTAAQKANEGVAVIAVMKGDPNGHVALVLPGKMATSPSWNLNVPNSASFFIRHPEKAYVGGPLSKAFTKADAAKAKLYYRSGAI